ncbi:hypothetical protein BC941DRAFT_394158, partial [Chlamydoabsidia padenii]
MRLFYLVVAGALTHTICALESSFVLTRSPDKDYNAQGQWIHLYKRHGDLCQKYHTAISDETCSSIAQQYGITLDKFYAWNTQVNAKCTNLKPTKKYCVSSNEKSNTECSKTHIVIKGDTCTKLALKNGISLGQFYDLNPTVNRGTCDNLLIGGEYCVGKSNTIKEKVVNKLALGTLAPAHPNGDPDKTAITSGSGIDNKDERADLGTPAKDPENDVDDTADVPPEYPEGNGDDDDTVDVPPEYPEGNDDDDDTVDVPPEYPEGNDDDDDTVDVPPEDPDTEGDGDNDDSIPTDPEDDDEDDEDDDDTPPTDPEEDDEEDEDNDEDDQDDEDDEDDED